MRWSKIFALYKKEWKGILRDRKTMMTLLIMSLLLYPLLFGVMGSVMKNQAEKLEQNVSRVVVEAETVSQAVSFQHLLEGNGSQFEVVQAKDPRAALDKKEIDAIVHLTAQAANLGVQVEYDDRYGDSKKAMERVQALAAVYKEQTIQARMQERGIAPDVLQPVQVTTNNVSGNELSGIAGWLPYILGIGLIAGSLNLGVEITAGEKERGTITTLLVSQFNRAEIAVGKLLTTLTMGIVSVVLNIISLVVTVQVMGKVLGEEEGGGMISGLMDVVSVSMVLQLFLILLPFGCMVSALIVLLGTYARNSKEGNLYNMPLMLIVMATGMSSSGIDANVSAGLYAVPFLGPMLAIKQVMLNTGNMTGILITFATSLVYTALLILPAVKLYDREEVMFRT
ncbi:MAG: ABC transporter permease [Tumebacillaceae bacterium]